MIKGLKPFISIDGSLILLNLSWWGRQVTSFLQTKEHGHWGREESRVQTVYIFYWVLKQRANAPQTGLDPRVPHFPRLIVLAEHCPLYVSSPIYFPLLQHSSEMDPFLFLVSAVNISSPQFQKTCTYLLITVMYCWTKPIIYSISILQKILLFFLFVYTYILLCYSYYCFGISYPQGKWPPHSIPPFWGNKSKLNIDPSEHVPVWSIMNSSMPVEVFVIWAAIIKLGYFKNYIHRPNFFIFFFLSRKNVVMRGMEGTLSLYGSGQR